MQLPGLFARLPMAAFRDLLDKRPPLRDKMIRYNELLLAQMQQSIACNALHDVESRLCRWLLQTQDRMGADVLPFTQDFIGQMLGVRRTTITLVARMLQGGDMIRCGGIGYTIDPRKPVGQRISDMKFLKTARPLEAGREYVVASWGCTAGVG